MASFDPAISMGLGLEPWVNHIAFNARDLDDIESRKKRWLDHGHDVVEIDHGFCVSIYTLDPSRILVEFCTDTAPYTAGRPEHALALISDQDPKLENPPEPGLPRGPEVATRSSPAGERRRLRRCLQQVEVALEGGGVGGAAEVHALAQLAAEGEEAVELHLLLDALGDRRCGRACGRGP